MHFTGGGRRSMFGQCLQKPNIINKVQYTIQSSQLNTRSVQNILRLVVFIFGPFRNQGGYILFTSLPWLQPIAQIIQYVLSHESEKNNMGGRSPQQCINCVHEGYPSTCLSIDITVFKKRVTREGA